MTETKGYTFRYAVFLSCVVHLLFLIVFGLSWHRAPQTLQDTAAPMMPSVAMVETAVETPKSPAPMTPMPASAPVSEPTPAPEPKVETPPTPKALPKPQSTKLMQKKKEPVVKETLKKEPQKATLKKKAHTTIQDLLSKMQEQGQVSKAPPNPLPAHPITVSELDAFRLQVQRCWNIPLGAKDLEKASVTLRLKLRKDGALLQTPQVVEGNSGASSAILARSAIHAVEQCQPFRLPSEKYESWKEMDVVFSPQDII